MIEFRHFEDDFTYINAILLDEVKSILDNLKIKDNINNIGS